MKPPRLLLALILLVGCLGAPPPGPGADGPPANGYETYTKDEFPTDADHDHGNPALHDTSFQVEFLAHHACTATGAYPKGNAQFVSGFSDIAFHEDYAFIGKGDGFCILDITNASQPKFMSHYLGEPAADLEITQDGNYVFLLTQRNTVPVAMGRSSDPTDTLPRGVVVVNVKDRKNPQFESFYPVPSNGVHTATPYVHGDRQLLSIQTYDWATPIDLGPVPRPNAPKTQRIEITELKDIGGRMTLQQLGMYSHERPESEPLAYWFPHDVTIQQHPVDKQTYLYAAYWDAGLVIVSLKDLAAPSFVSRYSEKVPSKYNAYHDVKVHAGLIDGRHITVTGPELQSASGEVGYFRIFDTTDPRKPVQLGAWTLPELKGFSGGFQFSPHVFQVEEGRIYLAHNHGGVWVVDIRNETLLKAPRTVGYYFPHGDEKSPETWTGSTATWGVYLHRGTMYATEGTQGVHVLRWTGDRARAENATADP